jgi:hypothetical protein
MKNRGLIVGAILTLLMPGARLLAHHSFSAEYDGGKEMQWTGTVTMVEWLNPHTRFYIDVKGTSGKVVNWSFELASPNMLSRRGWRRDSLKIGDAVTVTGYPAKDGYPIASAKTVMLPDGRKVFVGSTDDGSPK